MDQPDRTPKPSQQADQPVRPAGFNPWWLATLAALALATLAATAFLLKPIPPSRVVISTGSAGGGYQTFAEQYRVELAKHGIELELRPSTGAVENLNRLSDPNSGVDLALFQTGLPTPAGQQSIVMLGHVFYEPMWLLTHAGKEITDIRELAGKKVAIGPVGSGSNVVATALIKDYGLDQPADNGGRGQIEFFEIGGYPAIEALESGALDAAFFLTSPKAPIVAKVLSNPKLHLVSLSRADAMTRRAPYLHKLVLPAGSIVPHDDLPPKDVTLVATTAVLLAREDLHPLVIDLMVEAARQVHGSGSILAAPGLFPNTAPGPFPLSSEAERYYKNGPGFLRQYLPLSQAIWAQRLLFFALPLVAFVGPIAHFGPIAWRWHMRRRIYRWYGELHLIEAAVMAGRGDSKDQLRRLHQIDAQLVSTGTPLAFSADLYSLRAHLHFVHNQLEERIAQVSRARLAASARIAGT